MRVQAWDGPEQGDAPSGCLEARNLHGRYAVPAESQHRPASQCVLRGEVWEPDTIRAIVALAGENDIVHAGAFFGDMLPPLSNLKAPNALVWAFEPSPVNHAAAEATVRMNGLTHVRLFHAGLGPVDGELPLRTHNELGKSLGGSSSFVRGESDPNAVRVPVVALDDLIAHRPIGVIHLDVEGFEQPALEGALEIVVAQRPAIILERAPDPQWIARHLAPLGYVQSGRANINFVFTTRPGAI